MKDALVSVVIPVFERGEVLHMVLRYFERQTYPSACFEVVVVDDGSRDRIGESLVARDYCFQLEVVVQPNRGRAAARNAGVKRAGGDLILFCDADRIPDPAWIAAHAEFHDRTADAAAVGTPFDCFCRYDKLTTPSDEAVALLGKYAREPEYFRVMKKLFFGDVSRSPVSWAAFLVGNSSVRRGHLLDAGGFDESLSTWGIEHFELALRLLERCGVHVFLLPAAASYHMPHGQNLQYYRDGIEQGIAALRAKHRGRNLTLLRDFLFGDISLQEFEQGWGGDASPSISSREPVYFAQLRRR